MHVTGRLKKYIMRNHALTLVNILLHHISQVQDGIRIADWDYIDELLKSSGWDSALALTLTLPDDISYEHLCEAIDGTNLEEAKRVLLALKRKLEPSHLWFRTFEELKAFYFQFVKSGKNPDMHQRVQKFFSGKFPHKKSVAAPMYGEWDFGNKKTNLECIIDNFEPQHKSA